MVKVMAMPLPVIEPQIEPQTVPARSPKMKARNVSIYYGDKRAIDNVSIDVDRDEVTAFIGPSADMLGVNR